MGRKHRSKQKEIKQSPLEGATAFQEAVEVATNRRQESEKECRIHYRALLNQCSSLPGEEQKVLVEEATEAYRDMLASCRMRFEADMRAARVLLDLSLGDTRGKRLEQGKARR